MCRFVDKPTCVNHAIYWILCLQTSHNPPSLLFNCVPICSGKPQWSQACHQKLCFQVPQVKFVDFFWILLSTEALRRVFVIFTSLSLTLHSSEFEVFPPIFSLFMQRRQWYFQCERAALPQLQHFRQRWQRWRDYLLGQRCETQIGGAWSV